MNENACLIVVDAQKDFTAKGGFYERRGHGLGSIQKTLGRIRLLVEEARPVLPVLFVVSEYVPDQFGPGISMCIPGSEGQTLALDSQFAFEVFTKHEHSAFSCESLCEYLARRETGRIFIAGFLTEYCIKATVLDGLERGFELILLEDGIATGDDKFSEHHSALKEMQSRGARLTRSFPVSKR